MELSKNPGVIALTGSEENAEKLARASEHYKVNPYLWALSNVDSPQTRVADLVSNNFANRLYVNADSSEYNDYRFSFGVLKDAEGITPKK